MTFKRFETLPDGYTIRPPQRLAASTLRSNLGTWELHEAISTEPDVEKVRTLNDELRARLDAALGPASARVRP